MRADVFGMSHAAHHAQRWGQATVQCGQFLCVSAFAVHCARSEHPTLVHHLHRWAPVLMHRLELHLAIVHNRIHMEDVTGHKLLQQVAALLVAQIVQDAPQLLWLFDFANPQRRRFRAGLQQPGRRNTFHKVAKLVVIQHSAKLRHQVAKRSREHPHSQLVAIATSSSCPHAGNTHVLANLRRSFQVELIQSHNAIESPTSRHPRDSIQNLLAIQSRRHGS